MPIQDCQSDGKPGFKWGESGHCYTYSAGDDASRSRAREKARKQGEAEHAHDKAGLTIRALAMTPTSGEPVIAAAGLAVKAEDTGRVLLHQRPLDDDNAPGKWEFPGGHCNPDEDPFIAACREFEEETGIEVPDGGALAAAEVAEAGAFCLFTLVIPEEFPLNGGQQEEAGIGNCAWFDPADVEESEILREEAKSNNWTAIKEAAMKPEEATPETPAVPEPAPSGTAVSGGDTLAVPPPTPSGSPPAPEAPGAPPGSPAPTEDTPPAPTAPVAGDVILCLLPDPDLAASLAVEGGEPPERLHLTLATLGSPTTLERATVEAAVASALAPEPAEAGEAEGAEPISSIEGTFDGLARFPVGDSGIPVVTTFSAPNLADLQGDLLESLGTALDLPDQAEGFLPHVTLRYVDGDPSAEIPLGPPPGIKATFSEIVLAFGDVSEDGNLTYFAMDGSDSAPPAPAEPEVTPPAAPPAMGTRRARARRVGELQVPAPGADSPPTSVPGGGAPGSVAPGGFDPANCLLARGTFANNDSGFAFASALKDGAPLWPSVDYSDATYLLSEAPDATPTENYSSALAIGVTCLPLQAQSHLRIVVLEDEPAEPGNLEPAPEGENPADIESQVAEALEEILGEPEGAPGPLRFLMLLHVEGMPTDEGGTDQVRRLFDPGAYRFRENGVGLPVHWRDFIAPGHDGGILGGWTSEMWRGASPEDLANLGLNDDGTPVVKGETTDTEEVEPTSGDLPMAMAAAAICACSDTPTAPVRPPAAWFDPPDLDGPTAIQVTPEGRVFGHLAGPDCFLSGKPGPCLAVRKHTSRDFSRFNHGGDDSNGGLVTAEGKQIRVGCITLAGGHPNLGLSASAAKKAYDDTESVAAFVRAGWDEKNDLPYVAGALRSDLPEAKAQIVRALGLSGDWRTHEDWRPVDGKPELIALPVVPTPAWGFRSQTRIAAAASVGGGEWDGELVDNVLGIETLAAAGGAPPPEPTDYETVLAIAAAALDARVYDAPSLDDLVVYGPRLEEADRAILGRGA